VFDFGLFWVKGQRIATGQANVKAYNRYLRDLIHTDRALQTFRRAGQRLDQGHPASRRRAEESKAAKHSKESRSQGIVARSLPRVTSLKERRGKKQFSTV
jgi:hypothetical protein